MRFLHTADWQIGMKAAHLRGVAARVRQERLKSARRVIDIANDRAVDFVVLAGDTFEDNGVGRDLVREVVAILTRSNAPVFVLPGNHDPVCPGSVWEIKEWQDAPRIHVLRSEAPVETGSCTLFPCPARERRSALDPTAWIPNEGEGIRVGIAHGSIEGLQLDEPDYPIPRDVSERKCLDYVALGHWHSRGTIPASGPSRVAYSGTHEPTKFGERDSGNALLVDIKEHGAYPSIEMVRTAGLEWLDECRQVMSAGDLESVWSWVEQTADPGSTLLRLTLQGIFPLQDLAFYERLTMLGESGRFLYCEVNACGLRPMPPDNAWLEQVTDPVAREAARRIALGECDAAEKAYCERALLELYLLSREVDA